MIIFKPFGLNVTIMSLIVRLGWKVTSLFPLFFLLTYCSTEEASSYLVLSKGEPLITIQEFKTKWEEWRPRDRELSHEDMKDLQGFLLDQMITKRLLLRLARVKRISISDEDLQDYVNRLRADYPEGELDILLKSGGMSLSSWADHLKEDLLIHKLLAQEIYGKITVTDEEARLYFEEHRELYVQPKRVWARHILVGSEEIAYRIFKALNKKGADFGEMARRYSFGPEAISGGVMGWVTSGHMPKEVDRALFSIPEGGISEVIKSPYGYHIFKVERVDEAKELSFEEARDGIKKRLLERKAIAFYEKLIDQLKESAEIQVVKELPISGS